MQHLKLDESSKRFVRRSNFVCPLLEFRQWLLSPFGAGKNMGSTPLAQRGPACGEVTQVPWRTTYLAFTSIKGVEKMFFSNPNSHFLFHGPIMDNSIPSSVTLDPEKGISTPDAPSVVEEPATEITHFTGLKLYITLSSIVIVGFLITLDSSIIVTV